MPQLDRYLAFSEIFWFAILFTASYLIIYLLLVSLIKGMRLRESFAVQSLLTTLLSKQERHLLNTSLLTATELKLLNVQRMESILKNSNNDLQLKGTNPTSLFQNEFELLSKDKESSSVDINETTDQVYSEQFEELDKKILEDEEQKDALREIHQYLGGEEMSKEELEAIVELHSNTLNTIKTELDLNEQGAHAYVVENDFEISSVENKKSFELAGSGLNLVLVLSNLHLNILSANKTSKSN